MRTYDFYITEDDEVHVPGMVMHKGIKLVYFNHNYQLWYDRPCNAYMNRGSGVKYCYGELLIVHVYKPHYIRANGESISRGEVIHYVAPGRQVRKITQELIIKVDALNAKGI